MRSTPARQRLHIAQLEVLVAEMTDWVESMAASGELHPLIVARARVLVTEAEQLLDFTA